MSRLTINFNLIINIITVNNVLANLCHSEYLTYPLVARMQAWRRLRYWSMPSSITLSFTPINTSIKCCLKSFTFCVFFSGRLSAPDFVIKFIEVRAVWQPEIQKFIWVSYIIARLDWRQQMMHRMSGQTQFVEKTTTSRIYQTYSVISQRI